ncbi:carbonic anhydrase-related protein 10 [Patella vulgata]|uniref:carbonic anhydrase-related protein 10 n=1 Tax=Patella vulgata TaxID=6465 RepID=UPI00217F4C95|nr:carbonic anhydrase-related protein 10 [Patella vulgata]
MFSLRLAMLFVLLVVETSSNQALDERISWKEWWSYEGPSGPTRWGGIEDSWKICTKGMYQSPINILPEKLLFDPNLMRLNLDARKQIPGNLINTGHDLTFLLDDVMFGLFNISDGPLMYNYQVNEIKIHYGRDDERGSEHMVDGATFAAEIQFIAYNIDLYKNISEARIQPYGTTILAVFAEIGLPESSTFQTLVNYATRIRYKGQSIRIEALNIKDLLPRSNYYVTYEGSFTQPGCQETVTWIIPNKPIYISKANLISLRNLYQSSSDLPVFKLDNSRRSVMPLNNRVVKTNINYPGRGDLCSMSKETFYEVNPAMRV